MIHFQKYLLIILGWMIIPFNIVTVEAELTIHVRHPWASDTARLNYGLFIIHSGNYYPGDAMSREAVDWFTFTFPYADTGTNQRFELVSYKSTEYVDRDSTLKYTGGTQQLIFKNILKEIPEATEIWLFIDDLSEFPRIVTQPPTSRVINFFNPWKMGAPRARLKGSTGGIKTSSVKMRGIPNFCGWVSYYYLDTCSSPVLQIINSADTTQYYGPTGLGDTNYIDFSGLFSFSDTIWILPEPFPDGPPSMHKSFPGKLGDCTPITLAGKIWDIGEQVDFGNNTPVTGYVKGIVQNRLGSNGKPVHNSSDNTVKALDAWYKTQTFPGGYTNIRCHNITLTKNEDGLYHYSTNEFFPVDDFKYLDDAGTIPNPNWTEGVDNHNFHFVMEMELEFEYVKGQKFTFRGDDDVWVYIDSQLVVDLGGVHGPWEGSVDLDTLGLKQGTTYSFKLFFAERHCCGSNFKIVTSINLRTSSNLFSKKTDHPDNRVQYDLFEKITQSNLTCDASGHIVDTVKARVDFYITGPGIGSPRQLFSGTHYGGVTIGSDYSQLIIDTGNVVELLPGDYTITYYSTRNKSQNGKVTFTVTKTPKPKRPENPVETASIFADNGDGRANRVEIYFRDPLEHTPDSIHIAWPSLLQSFNFSGNSIARDESDKRHCTVKLGKTFPIRTTGIVGADYLGTWYSTDTSYAKPFAAVRFKIADSIGALITEASWYERTNPGPDTFLLTFSEPIEHSLLKGKSVQLIKRDMKLTITVLNYELQGNNLKIITENTGYKVEVGDSLRFNPDGPVRDNHGNKPHPQNLPALITIRERPPFIKHAFYQDKNADGIIDRVVLEFDKSIVTSEIKGTFIINKIKFSVSKTNKITYSGNNRSKIIFDLSNSVPEEMNGITTGAMDVQIEYKKFPGIEITNSVQDSAAPVLMRALFSEGISEIDTETDTPDTLQITFSEEVQPITAIKPFTYKSSDSEMKSYALSIEKLKNNNTIYTFIVTEIHGEGFPSASDSVYIDPDKGIKDMYGNEQINPLNRRVLLEIKPIPLNFKITAGPSPFNPETEKFTIKIKPTLRTKTRITCEIEIVIFDALGNRTFNTYKESTTECSITWDGFNRNGRIVGNGTYLLLVNILNKSTLQSFAFKRLFSVKIF